MAETPSTPSAHMGESSVVSVSRRSERRRTGFTLVEEPAHRTYEPSTWGYAPAEHQRSVAYVQDQDRWPSREPRNWAASNTSAARDDRFGWGPAEPTDADRAPATPPHAYAESAQARRGKTRRRARQAMRFEPGSSCETEAPGYEVRSPFFTEEDYRAQRQTPGAKRRRAAVAEALATIPRAVASGVASAFGRLYLLVVAVIVVALVTSIYGPARSLYVANRRLETLQATYDALQAENDSIRNELELLQTREGIENEARARGYVQAGETKVLVENLPDELTSKGGAAEAVAEVEVTQDQPWYIQLLDVVFAYEPQT